MDKTKEVKDLRMVACEPEACPTLTKGLYAYDFGDTAHLTPLVRMHTLGSTFVPAGIHAGGLRYHGMAPQISALVNHGFVEAKAVHQLDTFEAAMTFTRAEGFIPAPETTHAIAVAIDEALKCKETGEQKVIAFNFSGHGHFDMAAYDAYLKGDLEDYDYPAEAIAEAMQHLPEVQLEAMQ